MGRLALRVEGLGKRYLIGTRLDQQRLVSQRLLGLLRDPFRRAASVFRGESTYIDHEALWALQDVSFEVSHGEVVGILGRNGAGKSTLLKVLARITAPTTGQAEMYGSLGALLEVGAAFHIDLTARENVYLHGSIYGRSRRQTDSIYDEIVAFAELEPFMDTQVKKFSSGMYSRLAFSVAAHFDSEILIVDEVLATGDVKFVTKCLRKMENEALAGRTVLFVSHSVDSIQRLCTRALLLDHGRLLADGPVKPVVEQYLGIGAASSEETAAAARASERLWETFPDGTVRLEAIRALGPDGGPRASFDVTEEVVLEVEYQVIEARHPLNVRLGFTDAAGHRLFVSMDNLDTPFAEATPAGRHRARCRIPANFLNQGLLVVEYSIGTRPPGANHATAPDALTLTITDEGRPGGVRGNWSAEWPSVLVRPRLEWTYLDLD